MKQRIRQMIYQTNKAKKTIIKNIGGRWLQ